MTSSKVMLVALFHFYTVNKFIKPVMNEVIMYSTSMINNDHVVLIALVVMFNR